MMKILIAEDEAKSCHALMQRLQEILGDDTLIDFAADGCAAIDKAIRIQPDLVFMDIEMPVKNGLEAAAVIRQQLPQTVIVFLTAYHRFDYAVGALRAGGNDYLLKPVSESALRELLHTTFHVEAKPVNRISPFEAQLQVWVHQHYTTDVALEDAAQSMGMSSFYFSRQIKAATGKTFLEYLTAYRIEKAKQRLESTDLSISEVAHTVGYSDYNYFSKVFKRVVGCTPSLYRHNLAAAKNPNSLP